MTGRLPKRRPAYEAAIARRGPSGLRQSQLRPLALKSAVVMGFYFAHLRHLHCVQ
jgi:hypothetical protein